jgi:hypothetical protein
MEHVLSFWIHPSQPNFDSLNVGGFFTLTHFLFILILSLFGVFTYRWVVRLPDSYRFQFYRYLAILLIGLELLRMGWNILASDGWYAKDIWPLYTCGIFVIVFPFYAFQTRYQRHVEGFIGLGAMLSGVLFLLFPSTGLAMFPVWHINTIISTLMHWAMALIGAIFFFYRNNKFTTFDLMTAFTIVSFFALISWLYNSLDPNTNFFFLAYPLAGTPLAWLYDWFGQPGYGISIFVLHLMVGIAMYFIHHTWIEQNKKQGN